MHSLLRFKPFVFFDKEGGEGPPAGYDPDSESAPRTPEASEGLDRLLDFADGHSQVADEISETAGRPDAEDHGEEDQVDFPAKQADPKPPAKPTLQEPPPVVEDPKPVEEILTAEKIKNYGLDPNEFKVGEKVLVSHDPEETKDPEPENEDPPAEPTREEKLLAALNGNVDIDWSSLDLPEQQAPVQQDPPQKPVEEAAPQPTETNGPISMTFVKTDEDLQQIVSSPENFNKFASDLVSKTMQLAMQTVIPQVRQIVPKAINQDMTVRDFFKDESNKDLVPIQKYFGSAMTTIVSKKPDLLNDLPTLLSVTAKAVRKNLGMPEQAKAPAKKQKKDDRPYVVRRSAQLPAKKVQGKPVVQKQTKQTPANVQEAELNKVLAFAENY